MTPAAHPEAKENTRRRTLGALALLFFFLADVQTGVGPFLAAYLAGNHWIERDVGFALTFGGLVTVVLAPAAGAWVDATPRKRTLVAVNLIGIVAAALLLTASTRPHAVYGAQMLIGAAGAFLAPTVAAMTLGIVGREGFDRRFGVNQAFNSAGNVFTAATLAGVSLWFGLHAIFLAAAAFAVPAWLCLTAIDPADIDERKASGADDGEAKPMRSSALDRLRRLCADRTLIVFFACCFLFHLANAAMLPQLGELLAHGNQHAAAPFMSACIVTTQVVITLTAAPLGRITSKIGRKPLLLAGFGVLPLRGVLYTVTHVTTALVAIQVLDGVANAIFVVVSTLVVADRMRGTGHFNFAQGALATSVGLGAAISPTFGGLLIHHFGYSVSFLGLAAVAAIAVALLAAGMPETLPHAPGAQTPAQC